MNTLFYNLNIESHYDQVITRIQNSSNSYLGLFQVIIVFPIFEEILFRGLIFNSIKKHTNLILAIILQALIFSIIHGNITQSIYTFISAIIYVLIYLKTNSIISPILMHIVCNFVGTVGITLLINLPNTVFYFTLYSSIVICIISFIFILKTNKTKFNEM
ncbi:lysostaphin resistance A-like protein [Oceanirhabdus sp. W0125-5]|uniref:CPBP family intramembrane glutamic endopeptidase n=1 Tax=Oceanirhabdus sp. W0125-5 TaxID=2999116 RepID=UPI003FA60FB0